LDTDREALYTYRLLVYLTEKVCNLSPCPLPLVREGGSRVREGRSPSLKSLPPLLEKERGIKGVRLMNNLLYVDYFTFGENTAKEG